MALGMTNSNGIASYGVKIALQIAEEAKNIAEANTCKILDKDNQIEFCLGCDTKGIYIITQDDTP